MAQTKATFHICSPPGLMFPPRIIVQKSSDPRQNPIQPRFKEKDRSSTCWSNLRCSSFVRLHGIYFLGRLLKKYVVPLSRTIQPVKPCATSIILRFAFEPSLVHKNQLSATLEPKPGFRISSSQSIEYESESRQVLSNVRAKNILTERFFN